MKLKYKELKPQIHNSVFTAMGSIIVGDVHIDQNSSIWYNCVLRGDVAKIQIGKDSNIQDGTIIHTSRFNGPCIIGDRVTVGHLCLLHACVIDDDAFVGMSSTVMDYAKIESFGFLAANSLLTPNKIIKSGEMWAGSPAKFIRNINEQEESLIKDNHKHYKNLANEHKKSEIV